MDKHNVPHDDQISLGAIKTILPNQLYAHVDTIDTLETTIAYGLLNGERLNFAVTPVDFSIASDDNADNQQIKIDYYKTNVTDVISEAIVPLNGNTPVSFGECYRLVNLVNISGNSAGTIYVAPTSETWVSGKPTNIYWVMVGQAGTSHVGVFYCPPNHRLIVKNFCFQTTLDGNNEQLLMTVHGFNPFLPNVDIQAYFPFTRGFLCNDRVYNVLTAGSHQEYTCQRILGTGIKQFTFTAYVNLQKLN